MSYEVDLFLDEPIIFAVWHDDFSLKAELESFSEDVRALLDAAPMPHFFITDMSAATLSLEDLIAGANFAVQGQEPIFKHATIRQVILVSQRKAIELTARGMKAASFGNLNIKVCATVDEALEYARA